MYSNLEHYLTQLTVPPSRDHPYGSTRLPLYATPVRVRSMYQSVFAVYSQPMDRSGIFPGRNDQDRLYQCSQLHPFLRKIVFDHFHDKICQAIEHPDAKDDHFRNSLLDLLGLKLALHLLDRFYAEKGFPVPQKK